MPIAPQNAEPTRSCAACRVRCDASALVRFTVRDGRIVPDVARRLGGRGLSIGPARRCLERAALRGALTRGLKGPMPEGGVPALAREIATEARAWLEGTLAGALRGGTAERVDALEAVFPPHLQVALAQRLPDGAPIIEGVPWLRVTRAGMADRVDAVAFALSEFTFAMAGDSTRRPKAQEACDVPSRVRGAGSSPRRDEHERRRAARVPSPAKRTGGVAE